MSAAGHLAKSILTRITNQLDLHLSKDENETFPLKSIHTQNEIGYVKVYRGKVKIVNIHLEVEAFNLDSHMIFAFTHTDSSIPHFTLDAIKMGDNYAFHLDLVPKSDLGCDLEYTQKFFIPIHSSFKEAQKIPGLCEANLAPELIAAMSPWMLAYRASSSAFDNIGKPVHQYLDHWLECTKTSKTVADSSEIEMRDSKRREILFNADIDPVWSQVEKSIGPETGIKLRTILKKLN